ncbi:hypothetical protein DFH09DRAFT_1272780 [Mycena vulgaris]|nr:hypothetical protein DFH09DRAFT_1272780 [Mycena vulgaris]
MCRVSSLDRKPSVLDLSGLNPQAARIYERGPDIVQTCTADKRNVCDDRNVLGTCRTLQVGCNFQRFPLRRFNALCRMFWCKERWWEEAFRACEGERRGRVVPFVGEENGEGKGGIKGGLEGVRGLVFRFSIIIGAIREERRVGRTWGRNTDSALLSIIETSGATSANAKVGYPEVLGFAGSTYWYSTAFLFRNPTMRASVLAAYHEFRDVVAEDITPPVPGA